MFPNVHCYSPSPDEKGSKKFWYTFGPPLPGVISAEFVSKVNGVIHFLLILSYIDYNVEAM